MGKVCNNQPSKHTQGSESSLLVMSTLILHKKTVIQYLTFSVIFSFD